MLHFLHLLLDEYLLNFNPVYNKESWLKTYQFQISVTLKT